MNYFLVDYENVTDVAGLRGTRYLSADDCIVIFYSNAAIKMRNDVWNEITQSGCQLKMYKLVNTRKNALDFYIATEAASLFERGERQIAIISRDKDLTSVVEFIKLKSPNSEFRIVRSPSLEEAMIQLKEPALSKRKATIVEAMQQRNLDNAYTSYKKTQALKEKIRYAFEDTAFQVDIEIITEMTLDVRKKEVFSLYNQCRHEFGNESGRQIYKVLKDVLSPSA